MCLLNWLTYDRQMIASVHFLLLRVPRDTGLRVTCEMYDARCAPALTSTRTLTTNPHKCTPYRCIIAIYHVVLTYILPYCVRLSIDTNNRLEPTHRTQRTMVATRNPDSNLRIPEGSVLYRVYRPLYTVEPRSQTFMPGSLCHLNICVRIKYQYSFTDPSHRDKDTSAMPAMTAQETSPLSQGATPSSRSSRDGTRSSSPPGCLQMGCRSTTSAGSGASGASEPAAGVWRH